MAELNFAEEAEGIEIIDGGLPPQTRRPMEFLKIFEQLLALNDPNKSAATKPKSIKPEKEGEDSELEELQKKISREATKFKRDKLKSGAGEIKMSVIKVFNPDGQTGHIRFSAYWVKKREAAPAPADNGESKATPEPTDPNTKSDDSAKTDGSKSTNPTRLRGK